MAQSSRDVTTLPVATGRRRLLMVAYACSPYHGSEPGLGWNRAVEAAKRHETTVLCEEHEFAADVRRFEREHGSIPQLKFEFVPLPRWGRNLTNIPGVQYLAFQAWHQRAFRVAQRLHSRQPFDLIHHVNFIGYREPGYLWKLDVPFVWGPCGGTQNFPWRFLGGIPISAAVAEGIRTLTNVWQLYRSRRVRRAGQKAAAVLAANTTNRDDLARAQGIHAGITLDVGFRGEIAAPRKFVAREDGLRLLWAGTLCARKALHLLIGALSELPESVPCTVRVMGDGALRRRWQKLAERRKVAHRIEWLGRLPHDQARRQFDWADVFVFTSLRDTTGTVLVEALAAGTPVICLHHQGARDVISAEAGIRVPVIHPRQVMCDLAGAVQSLASDPARYEALSRGAVERAQRYSWEQLGCDIAQVYERVLRESDASQRASNRPRGHE